MANTVDKMAKSLYSADASPLSQAQKASMIRSVNKASKISLLTGIGVFLDIFAGLFAWFFIGGLFIGWYSLGEFLGSLVLYVIKPMIGSGLMYHRIYDTMMLKWVVRTYAEEDGIIDQMERRALSKLTWRSVGWAALGWFIISGMIMLINALVIGPYLGWEGIVCDLALGAFDMIIVLILTSIASLRLNHQIRRLHLKWPKAALEKALG